MKFPAAELLSGFILATGMAAGAVPEEVRLGHVLHYEGRFLGLPVMKTEVEIDITGNEYLARADFRASGLAGFFVKSVVTAQSRGVVREGELIAQTYAHTETMPKKTRSVEIDRTGAQARVSVNPPFGKQGDPPATPQQIAEATDPLAGLLNLGFRGCRHSVKIFDSKLRYDLVVNTPPGDETPDRCKIGYKPIAGFDAEDMENPDQYRSVVSVQLKDVGPGFRVIETLNTRVSGLPVSVRLKKVEAATG